MTYRPRRSVLYIPGDNARAIEKAATLACDAVILDLEDAVAPEKKAQARVSACEAVAQGRLAGKETIIRVNPFGTPFCADDIVAACAAEPHAILFPKIAVPADIARAATAMAEAFAPKSTALWLMIETPRAMLDIATLCTGADPRLAVLVMGLNDLSKDTRVPLAPGRAAMLPWLSQAVLAARAYGLDILDGVYNAIHDAAGFEAECRQGRMLGFDGKSVIHPNQIAPANQAFSPSPEEIAEAQAIVAAFAAAEHEGAGVIKVQGRMVERLHLTMAERLLAVAQAAGLPQPLP